MKRVISIFLAVVMLFTLLSSSTIQAFAYLDFDFAESGCIGDYEERPEYAYNDPKNGTNVTYTFDKATGTLVFTHHPNVAVSGKMAGYGTSPFAGKAEIKHLIVNEGVTGFCTAAFKNCTGLVDVSLPSTITEIADNAFFNCTSLKSIELKNAVKSVGMYAFYGCTALQSVKLNDGLEVLDSECFMNCTSLESITIPQSVTEISSQAFCNSGIKTLTIQNSECVIKPFAFNACQRLTIAALGNKATIKSDVFSYCTNLKSITIPGVNESVLEDTFYNCTALESVKLLSGVKRIEEDAFNDCEAIKTIEIPITLTKIDSYVFRDCEALKDVYYAGTQAQWNAIDFGKQNENLTGATIHFNESGPTDEHKPAAAVKENEVPATCTAKGGYDKVVYCADCGKEISRESVLVPALGHSYKVVKTPATATTVGMAQKVCTRCKVKEKAVYTAPTGKLTLKTGARTANAIKVQWNNVKTATGYQVQISNAAGNKWVKTITCKPTVNAYVFGKLAAGNNYKFRVRFYIKAADKKNYFSPWSATLNSPTLPTGTVFTKLTPAKRAFVAQWKKAAVNGYQVQYATNAKFIGAKTVTLKGASKYTQAIKNLKGGARYYVRIHTYKTIGGKNYFSSWSAAKAVRTKR